MMVVTGKTVWFWVLAGMLVWPAALLATEAQFACRVVAVPDGDTLRCQSGLTQHKIRLHQIDAPEADQAYGQRARAALAARVYGRAVVIEPHERDKYGRLVARVWQGDRDINLLQVSEGWAWVYRQYADEPAYFAAEQAARTAANGLWAAGKGITPWQWRRGERKSRPWAELVGTPSAAVPASKPAAPQASWACGSKQRCSQMQSCAEARYHLNVCKVKSLDGNNDGVPCASLCR